MSFLVVTQMSFLVVARYPRRPRNHATYNMQICRFTPLYFLILVQNSTSQKNSKGFCEKFWFPLWILRKILVHTFFSRAHCLNLHFRKKYPKGGPFSHFLQKSTGIFIGGGHLPPPLGTASFFGPCNKAPPL